MADEKVFILVRDRAELKTAIAVAVIAGIATLFLGEFSKWVWIQISDSASVLYISYINSIYSFASSGVIRSITLGSAFILKLFLLSIFYSFIFMSMFNSQSVGRIERDYAGLKKKFYQEDDESSYENIESEIGHIGLKVTRLKKMSKFIVYSSISLFVVAFISISYVQVKETIALNIVENFEKRLAVLSPYLDQQEEEIIFSRWVTMTGRDDYNKIQADLESRAEKFDITLPERWVE